MTKYKVSIITPCYNVNNLKINDEDYFMKNFTSVFNQSIGYENIEHIFVDDCSTDGTNLRLLDLEKKYANVKVILLKQNNGNPSIPRNIGLKNATADHVMFLDQDDILIEDSVERLYESITSKEINLVSANVYFNQGEKIIKNKYNPPVDFYVKHDDDKLIDYLTFLQSKIFDRKFLLNNDIKFPNSYNEDVYFYILCLCKNKKNVLVLNTFYSFIYTSFNPKSITKLFNKKIIFDYVDRFEDCMELLFSHNREMEFIEKFHTRNLISIMSTLLLCETNNEFHEMFLKSKSYLQKYEQIPNELNPYWKINYYLIINNHFRIFKYFTNIIQSVYETNIFKNLFRNR